MENNLKDYLIFAPKKKQDAHALKTDAVAYTRVSDPKQVDNTSLGSQRKSIDFCAEKRKLNIVHYFGNKNESAKTDDRKEFNAMLDFVKRNKNIGYIIVYSFERFTRTGAEGILLTEKLREAGVMVISATQDVDYSTYTGAFQRDMFFAWGKMDNEMRRDKCMTGMRERLRKGYHANGAAAFGYTNLNPGKGKIPNLVINADGELLREAFQLRADYNLTYEEITQRLRIKGWKKPYKKLSEYFRNPFYAGIIVNTLIPGEVIQGTHPPLVSHEVFKKVNDMLRQRVEGIKYTKKDENLPLKQFVRAASCGTHYTGYLVKQKGIYYYKNNRIGSKENKSAKAMHELFLTLLNQYQISDPQLIELLKQILMEEFLQMLDESMSEISQVEKQIHEIETNLHTVRKRFALGLIPEEIYKECTTELDEHLRDLQARIQNSSFNLSNLEKAIDVALGYALNLPQTWASGDLEVKKRIQKLVFPDGLVYDHENHQYRTPRVNTLFAVIPDLMRLSAGKKNGTKTKTQSLSRCVLEAGLEPARPNGHRILSPACLPIPPFEQILMRPENIPKDYLTVIHRGVAFRTKPSYILQRFFSKKKS